MADDRQAPGVEEELATVKSELKDLRETLLARASSRPTGTTEWTILPAAPVGTLLLNGATVSRVTYAALWAWASAKSLVGVAGLFTVGDGSTTFGLPNAQGRSLFMAGTLGSDTYAVGGTGGSAFRTLTDAQMPSHDHGGGTTSSDSHSHTGTTDFENNHGGHTSGTANVVPPGSGVTLPSFYSNNFGGHDHGFGTSSDSHSHTFSSATSGSDQSFDNRPAYFVMNAIIYT